MQETWQPLTPRGAVDMSGRVALVSFGSKCKPTITLDISSVFEYLILKGQFPKKCLKI